MLPTVLTGKPRTLGQDTPSQTVVYAAPSLIGTTIASGVTGGIVGAIVGWYSHGQMKRAVEAGAVVAIAGNFLLRAAYG